MIVLIGRTFKYEKENKLFIKGMSYPVKKELAQWITRKGLGVMIPEVQTNGKGNLRLKDIKGPPKDKMIKENDVKTK